MIYIYTGMERNCNYFRKSLNIYTIIIEMAFIINMIIFSYENMLYDCKMIK